MKSAFLRFTALFTLFFGVLAAAPILAQDDDLEDLRLFLPFIPNIQFSAVYVAIEKGYFAEEGFNVVLEYGDENVAVDLVAAGELQFALISGEQVLMARAGQRPVVYVYGWFQRFPVGIVVPDTTEGVESIADLAGRNVGIPGRFGASYSGLIAGLDAFGLTEFDINLEAIGFAAPDVMCLGGVEAAVVYVNNEPLQIQNRADAGDCGDITSVSVLPFADVANMVSNGMVTNEATIADDPDRVQAVVRAFHRGLADTINNPAETYLLSLPYVDNLPITNELRAALESAADAQVEFLAENPDREAVMDSREAFLAELRAEFDADLLIQFEVLLETLLLMDADRLGMTDDEDWERTLDIITGMDLLPGSATLEGAYTDAFLPPEHETEE